MQSRSTIVFLTIVLSLVVTPLPIIYSQSDRSESVKPFSRGNASLAYTEHGPINISSDAEFLAQRDADGWTGNGTESSPYIIDGYNITHSGYSIAIAHVSLHFVIQNCFFRNSSNIQTDPYDDGIYLLNVSHCTIFNNTCHDKGDAAIFVDLSHCTVLENEFTGNRLGIVFRNSSCNVTHNRIYTLESSAILTWGCFNSTFSLNQLSAGGDAVLFQYSDNCILSWNRGGRIRLECCKDCTLRSNSMTGYSDDGVYIDGSSDITVTSNNITVFAGIALQVSNSTRCQVKLNRFSPSWYAGYVYLENSTYCSFELNTVLYCHTDVRSCQDCTFVQNQFQGSTFGLSLCQGCTLIQNQFDNYRVTINECLDILMDYNHCFNLWGNGISIYSSSQVRLTHNFVEDMEGDGITVMSCDSCHIEGNVVRVCRDSGIDMEDVSSSTISYNWIGSYDNFGIRITSGSNNRLYGNRLSGPWGVPATDEGNNNQWDDGVFIGNFWDNIEEEEIRIPGTAESRDNFARPTDSSDFYIDIHDDPLIRVVGEGVAYLTWIVWCYEPYWYLIYRNGYQVESGYLHGSGSLQVEIGHLPDGRWHYELVIYPTSLLSDPPLSIVCEILIPELWILYDRDYDQMPDSWEIANGLNPNVDDGGWDADSDGLFNLDEYYQGTDPQNPDSDSDLILDGWEVRYGLDPLDASDALLDLDQDQLTNLQEFEIGSNPNCSDSDSDTFLDAWEVRYGFDPTNPSVSLAQHLVFHSLSVSVVCVVVIVIVGVLYFKHRKQIINLERLGTKEKEDEQTALEELLD